MINELNAVIHARSYLAAQEYFEILLKYWIQLVETFRLVLESICLRGSVSKITPTPLKENPQPELEPGVAVTSSYFHAVVG